MEEATVSRSFHAHNCDHSPAMLITITIEKAPTKVGAFDFTDFRMNSRLPFAILPR